MDFVSQSSLEAGLQLPDDGLGHREIAISILEKLRALPAGSMVSIQGPWGRGKTDVLARIAISTFESAPPQAACLAAIWINPWQYGTPDLLSPIVIELLERITPEKKVGSKALWKAAETIIKAGLSFGLKATSITIPGGKIYEAAADEAKNLLDGLFRARDLESESVPDPDPVSEMGKRFAELVTVMLTAQGFAPEATLLICIDDLDRCLPHRQVALLEALRFLTSAGAKATILVALDPVLARQSVIAHYGTDVFDPDRYLDKMFDLRLNLPSVSADSMESFLQKQLRRSFFVGGDQVPLSKLLENGCGGLFSNVVQDAKRALFLIEFRNPRMVRRIFDRLYLLASSGRVPEIQIEAEHRWLLVLWLALSERRPELRAALQDAGEALPVKHRFFNMFQAYGSLFDPSLLSAPERTHVVSYMRALGMPHPEQAPDLTGVFQWILEGLHSGTEDTREGKEKAMHKVAEIFWQFDKLLIQVGL